MTSTTIYHLLSTTLPQPSSIHMFIAFSIPRTRPPPRYLSATSPSGKNQQDHPPLQAPAVRYRLKKQRRPILSPLILTLPPLRATHEVGLYHRRPTRCKSQTSTTNSMSLLIISPVKRPEQCTKKVSPSCTIISRRIRTRSRRSTRSWSRRVLHSANTLHEPWLVAQPKMRNAT